MNKGQIVTTSQGQLGIACQVFEGSILIAIIESNQLESHSTENITPVEQENRLARECYQKIQQLINANELLKAEIENANHYIARTVKIMGKLTERLIALENKKA